MRKHHVGRLEQQLSSTTCVWSKVLPDGNQAGSTYPRGSWTTEINRSCGRKMFNVPKTASDSVWTVSQTKNTVHAMKVSQRNYGLVSVHNRAVLPTWFSGLSSRGTLQSSIEHIQHLARPNLPFRLIPLAGIITILSRGSHFRWISGVTRDETMRSLGHYHYIREKHLC